MGVSEKWEWFCGINSSDISIIDDEWTKDSVLNNSCFIDALDTIPQITFIIAALLLILILAFCTRFRRAQAIHLLRFPGHEIRWILLIAVLILLLGSIAEGVLSDASFARPTQPHLYLPQCCAFLATIAAVFCYQHMEVWQAKHLLWPIIMYWVASFATQMMRVISLEYQDAENLMLVEAATNSSQVRSLFEIARYDFTLALLVCYGLLFLVEVNAVRLKICGCCQGMNQEEGLSDMTVKDMFFKEQFVNCVSEYTYWWLNWLPIMGYKRPIVIKDLGTLPHRHQAKAIHVRFNGAYQKEKERSEKLGQSPSLWRVYIKVHGLRMLGSLFVKILTDLLSLVGPLALDPIVAYVTVFAYGPDDEDSSAAGFISVSNLFKNGFFLLGVTVVASLLHTVGYTTYEYWAIIEGIHVRSAIQTTVYEKSLRLSTYATSGGLMTMGEITNHMSTDAMNLFSMFQWANILFTIPLQVIEVLVLLYFQMGSAALLGACVFFVIIPVQMAVGGAMAGLEKQTLEYSDKRLKDSNELLQGIKLLKLYGWEDMFLKAIEKVRNLELWSMAKINWLYGMTGFLTEATPLLVTLISFGTYTLITGKDLTPQVAFSSLALFNLLAGPLFLFPLTLFLFVNGTISTRRLQNFLAAPEVEGCNRESQWKPASEDRKLLYSNTAEENATGIEINQASPLKQKQPSRSYGAVAESSVDDDDISSNSQQLPEHIAIKISSGNFAWDQTSSLPSLTDINVEIPAGKLTMVVGAVGSGKSSLMSAFLGEMTTLDGNVQFNSYRNSIAYAGQKAWLVNASLKDNVLFGETLDNRRYNKVLDACALKQDIDILPGGDKTEIGEKGINLSGGQKQRVSVARSVYAARDIVIMDDPLSALDVHVGAHVFQEAIVGMLLKKRITVILVTHQLQYLQQADQIIVMKDCKIAHRGRFDEIQQTEPELYSGFQRALAVVSDCETDPDIELEAKRERMALQRQVSRQMSISEESSLKRGLSVVEEGTDETGRLIEEEEMERGSVSSSVYMYYLKALGWPCIPLIFFYIMSPAFTVATNFWLSAWSEAGLQPNSSITKSLGYYIGGYAGLSFGGIFGTFMSAMLVVIGCYYAAKSMHYKMLTTVIKAPMRFFDTTPLGRILNRFSADTQTIDMKLLMTIDSLVFFFLTCIAAILVNAIVSPWFLLTIVPIGVLYYFLQQIFITSSRELQRLDSTTKSPIFAYFSETLGGLPTIRAYGDQQRFYDNIMVRVTENNTAFLYLQTMNRWLAIRLDFVGAIIILVSGLTTIITAVVGYLSPSDVGLAISYALQVSWCLNLLVRFIADMEMQMNAVERVKYYISLPTEPSEGREPQSDWPQKGEIQAQNISVRYARELDPVIKDVDIKIQAGQKVGICGRTGSGKSSLTLALFRIIDTFKGRILIDGEDIAQVPLTTLRRRLAIIPQDPVLFNGSVRFNLDPDNQKSDQDLWDAIEIAQLKTVVTQLDGGLDATVSEGGENFSVGQRQLFCLARAFLRKSRILIMDEATASIDQKTDQILQKVVATAFADRTVLTIAHRVATILDSDSIIALRAGEIVEHDSPENLLADENSLFSSLVKSDE